MDMHAIVDRYLDIENQPMPTYEYKCDGCDHAFERFQSITAPPIRLCPQCGKPRVRRLLGTGAGLIFKGSGFYITDYRSESYKSAAKADSNGSASGSNPSKTTADSGQAVKSESKSSGNAKSDG